MARGAGSSFGCDELRNLTDDELPKIHEVMRGQFPKLEGKFGHGDDEFQKATEKADDLADWLANKGVDVAPWLDEIWFTDLVDEAVDFLTVD